MAFWRKKEQSVSLTDLLSRSEYIADFQAAERAVADSIGTSPELQQVEASCGRVSQEMVKCMEQSSLADPKCILLHHAFLVCAAKTFSPSLQAAFVNCVAANKSYPERCDGALEQMWSGVNARFVAINAELRKDVLSDADAELLLDCDAFKDKPDRDMEEWLQCTVPKRCPTQYQQYAQCLAKNGAGKEKCFEAGRPLVTCLSDMVARYSQSKS
jgi:hypothetical protein